MIFQVAKMMMNLYINLYKNIKKTKRFKKKSMIPVNIKKAQIKKIWIHLKMKKMKVKKNN
jgi:hypothetical protein